MTPVRTAVVGLGYWGPNLLRNLHEIADAEISWICDADASALARSHARYPAPRATTAFDDVLADPDTDAVVIATPVSTHHKLAAAALEAGKHVFVEKPFVCSSEEALDLVERARVAGRMLMPGHTFLYSPPVNLSREIIQSGELGDVYFITMSRVNLGLHQPDASVVWDLAPHDFSILRHWLGEVPVRVAAMSRSCIFEGTPDVAFINLEYASGIVAHVELSWLSPSKLRRTAVVGSRKMLVYDDTSNESVRVFDSGADLPDPESFGEYQLTYRTGDIMSPRVEVAEPLSLELTDFCTSARTGQAPRSSPQIGLDVLCMLEAVDRSLARGGQPVDVRATALTCDAGS